MRLDWTQSTWDAINKVRWTSTISINYENYLLTNSAFWFQNSGNGQGVGYLLLASSDSNSNIKNIEEKRTGQPSGKPEYFHRLTNELTGLGFPNLYGIDPSKWTPDTILEFRNQSGEVIKELLPSVPAYLFATVQEVNSYITLQNDATAQDEYAKTHAYNYEEIKVNINPLNTVFSVYRTGNWKPTTVVKWKSDKIGGTISKYSEDEVTVLIRAYNPSRPTTNWIPELPVDGSTIPEDTKLYVLYSGRFSEKKFKIAMTALENYNPNWWVKPLQIPSACVYEMWVRADDGNESRHAWAYFTNDNDLHFVTSPYKIPLTKWRAGYYYTASEDVTTAIIAEGDGESDDDYTNPEDDIIIPDAPSPFTSLGFLNTSYALTRARCKSFSNFIWTAGLFDNIKLMNQSPIENIVSCKIFPMSFTGTDETMKLGNVETTTGSKIGDTSTFLYDIGTVSVKPYYNSFLDYSPYTTLSIFLPFCGIHELDCKLLMGKSLNVKYAVDVVCGTCKALLYVEGVELYSFDGQMGIDIPIASETRAQVEKALISGAVSTISSIASQNPVGVATSLLNTATSSLHNQSSGSHSSATSAYETLQVYLIYDRPIYQNIEGFAHAFGRFCGLTKNLGNLDGFTVCNENVELSGIVCSSEEKEELKSLLTGGVFL